MKTRQAESIARSTYMRKLAMAWIAKNRPDVERAIRELGEEKYPFHREKLELPGKLMELK